MGHLHLYCSAGAATKGEKWYPFPAVVHAESADYNSKVRCRGANLCTGGVNTLSKGSTEAGAVSKYGADCFELKDKDSVENVVYCGDGIPQMPSCLTERGTLLGSGCR